MPHIRKSVLVAHSAQRMFDLVADVPLYPSFMPWCSGAAVEPQADGRFKASIEIDFKGVRSGFTTLNSHHSPERIDMTFADGPFSSLVGAWTFMKLDESACKVQFALDYEFTSGMLGRVIAPVFDYIAGSFVDAFSRRAEQLYGG